MNDSGSSTGVVATKAVTPADIDISKGLVGRFGIVAQHIACNTVRLCQKAQNWTTPISFDELASISSESRGVVFATLCEFSEKGFFSVQGGEHWLYTVTPEFITACAPTPPPSL